MASTLALYLQNVQAQANTLVKSGKEISYKVVIIAEDGSTDRSLDDESDVKSLATTIKRHVKFSGVQKLTVTLLQDGKKVRNFAPFINEAEKKEEAPQRGVGGFGGLGEAEILGMIEQRASEAAEKRIAEIQHKQEFEALKKENEELKEEYKELDEQYDTLYEKYEQITNTTSMIKGIIGTAREIGFNKIPAKIEAALAGFLDNDQVEPPQQHQITDNSGIVNDDDEQTAQARKDLIEFISSASDYQIKQFYAILYSIEQDFKRNSELIVAFCKDELKIKDIPN